MVTHDAEAAAFASRVVRLRDGRITSDEEVRETISKRPEDA
jgi:ABC-type lipoprotein export system ATPase subunit